MTTRKGRSDKKADRLCRVPDNERVEQEYRMLKPYYEHLTPGSRRVVGAIIHQLVRKKLDLTGEGYVRIIFNDNEHSEPDVLVLVRPEE